MNDRIILNMFGVDVDVENIKNELVHIKRFLFQMDYCNDWRYRISEVKLAIVEIWEKLLGDEGLVLENKIQLSTWFHFNKMDFISNDDFIKPYNWGDSHKGKNFTDYIFNNVFFNLSRCYIFEKIAHEGMKKYVIDYPVISRMERPATLGYNPFKAGAYLYEKGMMPFEFKNKWYIAHNKGATEVDIKLTEEEQIMFYQETIKERKIL